MFEKERCHGKKYSGLEAYRSIPLSDVLLATGALPDRADKHNWKTPVGRVSVDGVRFYCHDLGKGGGGAIDLIILLQKTTFSEAIKWLATEFGAGVPTEQLQRAPLPPQGIVISKIPGPSARHWLRVREYLISTRHLSAALVDQLHEAGQIYADEYANAVFILAGGLGAELRGTGLKKFHGARGEKGPFILPTLGPLVVAFVESGIDCLSLRTMGLKAEIVSLTGNAAARARGLANEYRLRGYKVLAAFDSDSAGEQMALSLGEPAERMRPPQGKDWNEALCLGHIFFRSRV